MYRREHRTISHILSSSHFFLVVNSCEYKMSPHFQHWTRKVERKDLIYRFCLSIYQLYNYKAPHVCAFNDLKLNDVYINVRASARHAHIKYCASCAALYTSVQLKITCSIGTIQDNTSQPIERCEKLSKSLAHRTCVCVCQCVVNTWNIKSKQTIDSTIFYGWVTAILLCYLICLFATYTHTHILHP